MTDSQKWLALSVLVGIAILIYLLSPILTPFLISILLAYLGDPLVDRLETYKLSRTLAVAVVFCVLSLGVLLVVMILLPVLQQELINLLKNLPARIEWVQRNVLPWLESVSGVSLELLNLEQLKQMVLQHWREVGGAAANIVSGFSRSGLALLTWVMNLVLIPVLTFYLLRDWDHMVARVHELIPRRVEPRVTRLVKDCDEILGAFMHGQLSVMIALGVIYSVGLWLIGLDSALLIGMTAGLVSFVPYLGLIVGIALAGIAAAMQFQDVIHVVLVIALFGGAQMVESMVLTPYLLGDRIGLHPVAVIFAVLAGGQLFGFFGVLLALPVAAVILVLLRHAHEEYVRSHLYKGGHSGPGDG